MNFASPEMPIGASKTYYVDVIAQCSKNRFKDARQESPFQSIDESMTKFKGRSSLKQYMPLKPTKKGYKDVDALGFSDRLWYTYNFNIYCGQEESLVIGSLGERMVNTLISTIWKPNATLCFDYFFRSVHLLTSLNFAALRTCMANRKKLLSMDTKKLKKREAVSKCNSSGLMYTKW